MMALSKQFYSHMKHTASSCNSCIVVSSTTTTTIRRRFLQQQQQHGPSICTMTTSTKQQQYDDDDRYHDDIWKLRLPRPKHHLKTLHHPYPFFNNMTTRSFASSSSPPNWGNNSNNNKNNNHNHNNHNNNSMLPPWMHPSSNESGHYLQQYTTNITQLMKEQLLVGQQQPQGTTTTTNDTQQQHPIIGRQSEINRCLQILGRRTKCHPLLIGYAGVGKTAIIDGLNQHIVLGQVPESMKYKQIHTLNVASLLAGSGVRGQIEERIQGLLRDIQSQPNTIILFIDEFHTIMNIGKGENSVDMVNILKPALARGSIQLIGATTIQEYQQYIEKDMALSRRMQTVYVNEPSKDDTISILRGIKTSYELHHSIRIKDEAIIAAVQYSDRYISDRKQPDKSIDLIDEACSRLKLELESKPEMIWKLENDLITRQIELSALENEDMSDVKIMTRKVECQKQVTELQKEVERLSTIWKQEKDELHQVKYAKETLEKAKNELDHARRIGDYNRAAELLHGTIPKLEYELSQLIASRDNHDADHAHESQNLPKKMLTDAVTADTIATIVARQTGIPVTRLSTDESYKLLHMEDTLRTRVIGQDHVITSIANCIRLSRTQLQSSHRTIGNFLFLGPTGVGKTETAKALAEYLFDDPHAMTRIDMSEYGEKHTVSRLIGAPPGYIGYEDAGVLTESVRRRPYQILLLDEFEKAHPDVWNLLLQVFDEGHLSDSHGRKVDFRNIIVIMTSNLGASVLYDLPDHIRGSEPEIYDTMMNVIRQHLSPELINRIDEIMIFNRLLRSNMDTITDMGIRDIATRLYDHQNMTLDVSTNARMVLSEMGYDIRYGARPLKRVLTREILNPLSRLLLEGTIRSGDIVNVRTRVEAEQEQIKARNNDIPSYGWVSSNMLSNSKNDIVIIKNHHPKENNYSNNDRGGGEDDDNHHTDDEYRLEDGTRRHG